VRNLLLALLLLIGSAPLAASAWAQDDLPRHRPRLTNPDEAESDAGTGSGTTARRRHAKPIEDEGSDDSSDEALPPSSRSRSRASDDSDDSSAYRSRSRTSDDSDEAVPARSRSRSSDDSDEAVPARRRSRSSDDSDDSSAYRSRSRSSDESDEAVPARSRSRASDYSEEALPADSAERPRSRRSDVDDEGRSSGRSYDDEDAPRRRSSSDDEEDWNSRPKPPRTAEEELRAEQSGDDRRLSRLDEPGTGLAAELYLGAIFLDDAIDGFRSDFAWGLGLTWQLGHLLFAPENDFLHNGIALEAGYLHPLASNVGTEEVRVEAGYHDLWLAALVGYPFKHLHVYGKIGPAMCIQPVSYDVQGQLTSWTATKGGLIYGIGTRTTVYLDNNIGIAARIELSRIRRGYMDDTLVSGGIGLAF
jgi:hypothetical protein